jgi:hypothetical protein
VGRRTREREGIWIKFLQRDARDGRRRCKVGFTFELRAVPLGIHAAIHPGHVGARRARLRRRTSNLVPVALVTSYSFTAIQLPSWTFMEQMWSRTGVLPSALLEVARFDSSLDLVRVPSGSALQQHAPVLRTTSYPYGSAKRPM